MDQYKTIRGLKTLPMYAAAMQKLYVNPDALDDQDKSFLLTVALLLLRKYQKDRRVTSYVDLAYHIILHYSLAFKDYEPLYDFSVNIGFYPISQAITKEKMLEFDDIATSILHFRIKEEFENNGIIETYDQKKSREYLLSAQGQDICYIAPTSFGKSTVILDHIEVRLNKKVAIIVPSKSLLMQTYRAVRKRNFNTKILIHDEMYVGQDQFIAVMTQERALRLMDKYNVSFDVLYIDEAHKLFDRDSRSIMLSRLVKWNRQRNTQSETIYLSPLIADANNLQMVPGQEIFEKRIRFNMKDPEYYEYTEDGNVYKYDRFLDNFYEVGKCSDLFTYIQTSAGEKNFCYLYAPRKIEAFSMELASKISDIPREIVDEIVHNLEMYIHAEFLGIDLIKKGIIYLHGKLPEPIKEYLEYKFATVPELKYLVANKVILEGINLPVDTLFIMNGTNMQEKDLINLIGRVNRLDQVFSKPSNLRKLLPPIHFVNSAVYNRRNGKLRNKMQLLKRGGYLDKIKNPVLVSFDIDTAKYSDSVLKKCDEIIEIEDVFFSECEFGDHILALKKRMISLGMNSLYMITDTLCQRIYEKIENLKQENLGEIHFLERLQMVFIQDLHEFIIDREFIRLNNKQAIAYYKKYYRDRKKSLKDKILSELAYFKRRIQKHDSLMYIGKSYGEIPYSNNGADSHENVYVDLETKSMSELVNTAIVKQKIEEDFTGFKLKMIFQLMYEYQLLTETEFHEIIYGTVDKKKIELSKMGLPINLINRLDEDKQLDYISFDSNGNLYTLVEFEKYRSEADDYFKFQLNRVL